MRPPSTAAAADGTRRRGSLEPSRNPAAADGGSLEGAAGHTQRRRTAPGTLHPTTSGTGHAIGAMAAAGEAAVPVQPPPRQTRRRTGTRARTTSPTEAAAEEEQPLGGRHSPWLKKRRGGRRLLGRSLLHEIFLRDRPHLPLAIWRSLDQVPIRPRLREPGAEARRSKRRQTRWSWPLWSMYPEKIRCLGARPPDEARWPMSLCGARLRPARSKGGTRTAVARHRRPPRSQRTRRITTSLRAVRRTRLQVQ